MASDYSFRSKTKKETWRIPLRQETESRARKRQDRTKLHRNRVCRLGLYPIPAWKNKANRTPQALFPKDSTSRGTPPPLCLFSRTTIISPRKSHIEAGQTPDTSRRKREYQVEFTTPGPWVSGAGTPPPPLRFVSEKSVVLPRPRREATKAILVSEKISSSSLAWWRGSAGKAQGCALRCRCRWEGIPLRPTTPPFSGRGTNLAFREVLMLQ